MFFVNNIFGFIVDANLLIKLNNTKAIFQNYAQTRCWELLLATSIILRRGFRFRAFRGILPSWRRFRRKV